MRHDVARKRYLEKYIEPGLPALTAVETPWQHVLVIPCYREAPTFLAQFAALLPPTERMLVIVVVNRPDTDTDKHANRDLLDALANFPVRSQGGLVFSQLSPQVDLYCLNLEQTIGPLPPKQGVGLARKYGCDLAYLWITANAIESPWIACTDADATLPTDYFARMQTAQPEDSALLYPFFHHPGEDPSLNLPTALYELRLHQYVTGLQYAGSPYAFHSLGSCLAIHADSYAHCRGFPRRAGGEDFYLLNKLAKIGNIRQMQGQCIALASRRSNRVPFGTGPAVSSLLQSGALDETEAAHSLAYFYHPGMFDALRCVIATVPFCHRLTDTSKLAAHLRRAGLTEDIAEATASTLCALGIEELIAHNEQQSLSETQFQRHFHEWLDGFRSLRLVQELRRSVLPDVTLSQLESLQPQLWPAHTSDIESLRAHLLSHWGWQIAE